MQKSYNLKLTEFPSGMTRVQIYSYEVVQGVDVEEDRYETEVNPFDGSLVRVYKEFPEPDLERSLNESIRRSKVKLYDYALSNNWEWFFTLTLRKEKVDRYDYDACVNALKNFLDRIRRKCPDLKYLFVPEQHEDGAYHFHGLVSGCDNLDFKKTNIVRNGKAVYNVLDYKLGFSEATKVQDTFKASGYICKYVTKTLCESLKNRKRYWASRNLHLPARTTMTVDFGGQRDLMLDTLFHSASYYRECLAYDEDHKSWFFEFPADSKIDFSQFEKFRYEGG